MKIALAQRLPMERTPRGFATTVVVGMLVLVAAAVLALTVLFATEMRRTRDARLHAQQRQLLLAGAAQARATLQSGSGQPQEIRMTLPKPLGERSSVTITLGARDFQRVPARITATVDGQSMRQSIVLAPGADQKWTIASATLEGLQ
jgi:hypothetical protein